MEFYFEKEVDNFSSSELKIKSKSWQLFKIHEEPCNNGVAVALEAQSEKASWSNFSFSLPFALVLPMQILFLDSVYPV